MATIHFFVSDEALQNISGSVVNLKEIDRGVGYLTDEMMNHFVTPLMFRDPRTYRSTVLANPAIGKLTLHTDNAFSGSLNLVTDISSNQMKQLFNVIERVYLEQTMSLSELNAYLVADTTNFGVFQGGSLTWASHTTHLDAVPFDDGGMIAYTPLDVRDYATFNVTFNGGQTIHTVKIWLRGLSFLNDYPNSTIIKVVFPCDPSTFLNMDINSNVVEAIANSATYAGNNLATEEASEDASGIYPFMVRYNNASDMYNPYQIPFYVLYKGARPTSQACRAAIQTALHNLGITTDAVWQSLFSDLYTTSMFFIVPMWQDVVDNGAGELVYGNMSLYTDLLSRISAIFFSTGYELETIRADLTIFHPVAHQNIAGAIPHADNILTMRKLSLIHPTYQAVDAATNPTTFSKQTSITQQFNEGLARAMAVAKGGVNTYNLQISKFEGKQFVSFTVNQVEYHVHKKDQ